MRASVLFLWGALPVCVVLRAELRSFKGHKPILKRSKGGDQTETDFLTLQIGFRAPLKICGYYRNLPAYVLIGDMRSDCKDKRSKRKTFCWN